MPQFAFSLEGVLQHRVRLEQQAQRALAERQNVAATTGEELKRLDDERASAADQLRPALTGRVDVRFLTTHRRYSADISQRAACIAERLALAQGAVDAARAALVATTKQRRVIETLKQRHLERWRSELTKRDAAENDDVTSRLGFVAEDEPTVTERDADVGAVATPF